MKCERCGNLTAHIEPYARASIQDRIMDLCADCTAAIENWMTHLPCSDCQVLYPAKELENCQYCERHLCPECDPEHDRKECASIWEERAQQAKSTRYGV